MEDIDDLARLGLSGMLVLFAFSFGHFVGCSLVEVVEIAVDFVGPGEVDD